MVKPNALLHVEIVQIGELPSGIKLQKVTRILNKDNKVRFSLHEEKICITKEIYPKTGFFFTEKELFQELKPVNEQALIVGVTSLRISTSKDAHDSENEYFGVWNNKMAPLDAEYTGKGVISVTRWRERYESRAYRSTEQYIAFMILAFLGDVQLGGLTHPWCTGCVFDYNLDDESIVSSIKAAALCEDCNARIQKYSPELRKIFEPVLRDIGRPPWQAVLRYLQGNGIASVFLFSGLLAMSVGLLQSLLPNTEGIALVISILCAAIFAIVVVLYRIFPSGELK